jgi:ATP-dependent exoDNAse (exonuclease V) beta subunit
MPVSKEEFERGSKITNEERAIINFLSRFRLQAFSQDEIARAVFPQFGQNILNDLAVNLSVSATLNRLVTAGKLVRRRVDFVDHYMLKP